MDVTWSGCACLCPTYRDISAVDGFTTTSSDIFTPESGCEADDLMRRCGIGEQLAYGRARINQILSIWLRLGAAGVTHVECGGSVRSTFCQQLLAACLDIKPPLLHDP